jgi:hypothetical protein
VSRRVAKPRMTLPPGYVAPALERVPGGADAMGVRYPLCRPDSHKEDGKHSLVCFAGVLGYHELEDGSFERDPLHPLDVDGARFTYRGDLYIRPAERGIVLEDDSYLENLPNGDYEARITLIRRRSE